MAQPEGRGQGVSDGSREARGDDPPAGGSDTLHGGGGPEGIARAAMALVTAVATGTGRSLRRMDGRGDRAFRAGPLLIAIIVTGLRGATAQVDLPLASEADGTEVYRTLAQVARAFDADQDAIVVDSGGQAHNIGEALYWLLGAASTMLIFVMGRGWVGIHDMVRTLCDKGIQKTQQVRTKRGGECELLTMAQAIAKAAETGDAVCGATGATAGSSTRTDGPGWASAQRRRVEPEPATEPVKENRTRSSLGEAIEYVSEGYETWLATARVKFFYSSGEGNDVSLSSMADSFGFDGRELKEDEARMLPFLAGKIGSAYFRSREALFQRAKMECAAAAGDIDDPAGMRRKMRIMSGWEAQNATSKRNMKFDKGMKRWEDEYRYVAMVIATIMQAEGNARFKARLLDAGSNTWWLLAEAKTSCCWWGIGHTATTARAMEPGDRARKWGENNAGKALMAARRYLVSTSAGDRKPDSLRPTDADATRPGPSDASTGNERGGGPAAQRQPRPSHRGATPTRQPAQHQAATTTQRGTAPGDDATSSGDADEQGDEPSTADRGGPERHGGGDNGATQDDEGAAALDGEGGATQNFEDESDEGDEGGVPALVRVVGGEQQLDDWACLPTTEGGTLTIGRGDADLDLTDNDRPQLQRRQEGQMAQLTHQRQATVVHREGAYFLVVHGTTMMTRVNGEAYRNLIAKGYDVPEIHLAHADLLGFGGTPSGADAAYIKWTYIVDAPRARQPDRAATPLPHMPTRARRPGAQLDPPPPPPPPQQRPSRPTRAAEGAVDSDEETQDGDEGVEPEDGLPRQPRPPPSAPLLQPQEAARAAPGAGTTRPAPETPVAPDAGRAKGGEEKAATVSWAAVTSQTTKRTEVATANPRGVGRAAAGATTGTSATASRPQATPGREKQSCDFMNSSSPSSRAGGDSTMGKKGGTSDGGWAGTRHRGERRFDNDGGLYTRVEFHEEYSGTTQWDVAQRQGGGKERQSTPQQPRGQQRPRAPHPPPRGTSAEQQAARHDHKAQRTEGGANGWREERRGSGTAPTARGQGERRRDDGAEQGDGRRADEQTGTYDLKPLQGGGKRR